MPVNWKATGGTLAAVLVIVFVLTTDGSSGIFDRDDSAPTAPVERAADPEELAEVATESDVTVPDDPGPGFYPPEDSTAVGMTPEWREFADQVDRICALSFNYMKRQQARIYAIGTSRGWTRERMESSWVRWYAWQGRTILKTTAKLGQPPERNDLFQDWRANVRQRAGLQAQAAAKAAEGDFAGEVAIRDRISGLKSDSDRLGQAFGLRICTSN
jgi:hypothetical protein